MAPLTTIASGGILDGTIVNADLNASAAIALSKLASHPSVLTGSTNNTICTVTGANAIQGEANLTFDGKTLTSASTSYPETTELIREIRAGVGDSNRFSNRYIKINQTFTGSAQGGIPIVWEANADGSNNKSYGAITTESNGDIRFLNKAAGSAVSVGTGLGLSERLRLVSDGKIGFNTSTIREQLHSHKTDSTENYLRFTNTGTGTGAGDGFNVGINGDEWGLIWQKENLGILVGTNGSERLRLDASGNLGIGTTSPDTKLTVSQAATGNLIKCLTTNNNTRSQIQLQGTDNSGNAVTLKLGGDGDFGGNVYTLTNHKLGFATNNAAPQMVLDTSGKLGIGTASPSDALEISHATDPAIRLHYGSNSGYSVINIDSNNDVQIHVDPSGAGSNSNFQVHIDGTEMLELQNDGDLKLNDGDFIVGTSGHGVLFHGHAAANNLDDYETGTWTPTGVDFSGTVSVNSATYVKVGQLVHIQAYISFDNTTDSSDVIIGGLPFTAGGGHTNHYSIIATQSNGAMPDPVLRAQGTTTEMRGCYRPNNDGDLKFDYNDVKDHWLIFGGTYVST